MPPARTPLPNDIAAHLLILVPKPNVHVAPIKGSGIVASNPGNPEDPVRVDFEGNIYDSDYYRSFWVRLFHAAGRHVERYPTIAREFHEDGPNFPFTIVGTFDYPQAIKIMRTRTISDAEAVEKACVIEEKFKELLQEWAGQTI
jgi:hypothetical protein